MQGTSFLNNPHYIQVMKQINAICLKQGVDQSHGLPHAIQIALHVKKALDCFLQHSNLNQIQQQNVIFAALLHDIDDHKYFKTFNNQNARSILNFVIPNENERKQKILRMIDLVSFSKNGNNVYEVDPIYYYFTRYADRVQALGLIGIYRTFLYSQRVGTPFYSQTTAQPQNRQEIYQIMKGKDLQYVKRGGSSSSVIDHMFDKILHIKLPKQMENSYLQKLYNQGHEYIVDYILQNAKNGYKDAKQDLLNRVNQWNEQRKQNKQAQQVYKYLN